MKVKFLVCCILVSYCIAGRVTADTTSVVQEVRAFASLADDEVWKKFNAKAEKDKAIIPCQGAKESRCFKGGFIADTATNYALTQEPLYKLVPEGFRTKSSYRQEFMTYNGFSDKDAVPVEYFRNLVTGKIPDKGLFYPQDPEYLKSIKAEPIKVASGPVVIKDDSGPGSLTKIVATKVDPVSDELDPINASLQATQKEISSLKASLKKLSADNTSADQLKGKISEIETQLAKAVRDLAGLTTGQRNLSEEQSGIAKKMQSEFDNIQATMVKINAVKAEIEAKFVELESEDSRLWKGIDKINDYYFVVTNSIIAVVLSILLYLGWERRRVSKIDSTVKNVEIDVDGIKLKLTNLDFDQSAVSNIVLKSMDYKHEKQLLVRNVSSGVNYVVGITRESEFMFSISGINRRPNDSGIQEIDIRKANLRNMIINAGEPLRFWRVSPEIVGEVKKAA